MTTELPSFTVMADSDAFLYIPKSLEILKFDRLQRDAKQCYRTKTSIVSIVLVVDNTMSTIQLYDVTALFAVFLQTSKRQYLRRFGEPAACPLSVGSAMHFNWKGVEFALGRLALKYCLITRGCIQATDGLVTWSKEAALEQRRRDKASPNWNSTGVATCKK